MDVLHVVYAIESIDVYGLDDHDLFRRSNREMNIQNAISMSVGILYIIPIILYFLTKQSIHIKGWVGLLGTLGLSEMLKSDFIKESNPRPRGARDCNLFCNNGDQSGRPGMPSGHSSTVAYFTSFYYQQTSNPWIKCGLIAYAGLVMLSRYLKRCHSLQQIAAGTVLGIAMSTLTYKLS